MDAIDRVAPRKHFRPRVYRTGGAFAGAVLMTAITAATVVLALVPGRAEAVGYVFAPLCAIATWRAWNWGVHVGTNGVKVCAQFFAKHIAWADIDRFALLPAGRYAFVGHVVRKDGHRPVMILAINADARRAQEPIDLLNQALDEWRREHAQAESPHPE